MSKWGFERLQEEIHRRLSEILQFETHDHRLAGVTVFSVKLSKDARYAWVSVGVLGDDPQEEAESLEALQEHCGFLRTALAKHLHVHHTPELRFELDETEKRARRIEELIEQEKRLAVQGR